MTVREKSLRITKQSNGNKKDCRKGSLFLLFSKRLNFAVSVTFSHN